MSQCSNCRSEDLYQYEDLLEITTLGGDLLPKLNEGMFASAQMRCVVCGECGLVQYFATDDALQRLRSSDHWHRVQSDR